MATKKRDRLHWLVDQLPDRDTHAAERYLEYLRASSDPVLRALLNAPVDDEEETSEEREAIEAGRQDMKAGRVSRIASFGRGRRSSEATNE